jgi:hypothetical protein
VGSQRFGKKASIKRILIKEPDDPRVSWNDWKKTPEYLVLTNDVPEVLA